MKTINKLLLAGAAVTALKGLDNRLEVTHYTVKSKKIPPDFDNFRISLFADFIVTQRQVLPRLLSAKHPISSAYPVI